MRDRLAKYSEELEPKIGRYRLVKKVGYRPGFSIFLALDQRTGREVVLEVHRAHRASGVPFTASLAADSR